MSRWSRVLRVFGYGVGGRRVNAPSTECAEQPPGARCSCGRVGCLAYLDRAPTVLRGEHGPEIPADRLPTASELERRRFRGYVDSPFRRGPGRPGPVEAAYLGCDRAPDGWWCSRTPGHDGPCAARPDHEEP